VLAIRTSFISSLFEDLRARGQDPASLASCSGVVDEVASLAAVADEVAARLGEPDLGVRLAGTTTWALPVAPPPADAAPAPTLADALARLAALSGRSDPRARLTFEVAETGGVLALHVAGSPEGLGRHGNEHALVVALRLAQSWTGRALVPRRAWLAHPEPADASAIRAALGCADLVFGAGDSGVVLDAEALAAPVATLPDAPAAGALDLVAELRVRLRPALGQGLPGVSTLARALGMSTRTLQRRLGELGTSYGDVLDDLRRDMARLRLEQRDLSVAAAARQLGYSDSRAFIRAFRRWTGATPGAYQVRA
jgi:AraC-like DNA-binding protein